MINDEHRGGDRQRNDDSQPNKRKRITTGNKSYDNNRSGNSSDSRDRKPLFSSDKGGGFKKPYQQDNRDSFDPNRRSFVKKQGDSGDQGSRPFIKKSSDSYNKESRPFIKKRTDDGLRPAYKKPYSQNSGRDGQSSYGQSS